MVEQDKIKFEDDDGGLETSELFLDSLEPSTFKDKIEFSVCIATVSVE